MAVKEPLKLDREQQAIILDVARQREEDPQTVLDHLVEALEDQARTDIARQQIAEGKGIPQSEMKSRYFPELRERIKKIGAKSQQHV